MLATAQFFLDFGELCSQPFAHAHPPELEPPALSFGTDVRKTQEVERFWTPETALPPVRLRMAAKFDQSGLFRVKCQRKGC
ncbi:hypothetical protein AiwAL_18095 [Acidiphilium sp. AL]|nr:hypothetical protein [Acidiphilium sp. AL]